MDTTDVLDRIPPARELREELGRTLRRADALKQLIKVAEKRGDDHPQPAGEAAAEAVR